MTTKSRNKPAGKPASSGAQQPAKSKKQPFVSRYIGIDTHLTERNGSTEQVYGIATERPAGRKLAQDIALHCNQLYDDGYDVISIFPLTGGRTAEATVGAHPQTPVHGSDLFAARTDTRRNNPHPTAVFACTSYPRYENKHYVDTGVGYSVTDGVDHHRPAAPVVRAPTHITPSR